MKKKKKKARRVLEEKQGIWVLDKKTFKVKFQFDPLLLSMISQIARYSFILSSKTTYSVIVCYQTKNFLINHRNSEPLAHNFPRFLEPIIDNIIFKT